MAFFDITDFIHLGIDVGVTETEWKISYDEEHKIPITHVKIASGSITLNDDMRIEEHQYVDERGIVDLMNYNRKHTGLYWNGESPIYISVRIFMNGKPSNWFHRRFEYVYKTQYGTVVPHRNVIDFDNLENYNRYWIKGQT